MIEFFYHLVGLLDVGSLTDAKRRSVPSLRRSRDRFFSRVIFSTQFAGVWNCVAGGPCQNRDRKNYPTTRTLTLTISLTLFSKLKPISLFLGFVGAGFVGTLVA